MNRRQLLITFLISLLLPVSGYSASVYETRAEFLSRAFKDSPPEPAIVWRSGERMSAVRQILGHDYAALRLRYWCEGERSAWILEEIGKDLPITVGIIIEKEYIKNLRVLTYRENRGGEVATASFTDQFNNAVIEERNRLDVKIDGISGATLSVQALTRLATMALFLNTQSSCKNGS